METRDENSRLESVDTNVGEDAGMYTCTAWVLGTSQHYLVESYITICAGMLCTWLCMASETQDYAQPPGFPDVRCN